MFSLRSLLVPGLAGLAAFAASCNRAATAPSWPAGTVMVVSGHPVSAAEIDEAAGWVRHATFEGSESHYRRLALEQVVLPRAAIASARSNARLQKLAEARELKDRLVDGENGPAENGDTPFEEIRTGNLSDLGIEALGAALELDVGVWSEIVEGPGLFYIVRKITEPVLGQDPSITLGVIALPYLEHGVNADILSDFMDNAELSILDSNYDALVPQRLKHMMGPK